MFTNHFPNIHLTQVTVTYCFRMHQESAEDGSLRRVQLDTALKALYTSSEGLSHTVEGDGEESGTRGDAMDTAEPSAHAQARIRYLCHCHSSLCGSFCTSVHVTFSHLLTSPLSFLVVSHRSKMKVQSARTPGSTMMVGGKNTYTNRYPWYIIYVPCTCIQIPLSLAQGQMVLCEICHIFNL